MAYRLGDRVQSWVPINEIAVIAFLGYGEGAHPPHIRGRPSLFQAIHNLNVAQSLAIDALRTRITNDGRIGVVLSLQPVYPADNAEDNVHAAQIFDAVWNGSTVLPLAYGTYPFLIREQFEMAGVGGEAAATKRDIDFIGINYYNRFYVKRDDRGVVGTAFARAPRHVRKTEAGALLEPDGLIEQLIRVTELFGDMPLYVTENGTFEDGKNDSCGGLDTSRITYISEHIRACAESISIGINLQGYFVWTFMDCYEWNAPETLKFGLVWVDPSSKTRCPKSSFFWYRDIIRYRELQG